VVAEHLGHPRLLAVERGPFAVQPHRVERLPQPPLALEPMLVQRLDAIEAPVAKRQEPERADHRVVVGEITDVDVVAERLVEVGRDRFAGHIAHTEHVHAVRAEGAAKREVARRKVWGNEDEVHRLQE
jgi:hypothetical protein